MNYRETLIQAPQRKKRRSRLRAAAPPNQTLRVTERDAAIIKAVHAHRFLRTDHIIALIQPVYGGSYTKLAVRIRKLFDEGYLSRPQSQAAALMLGTGSPRLTYGLNRKAPEVLERFFHIPHKEVRWQRKRPDDRVGHDYQIDHALAAADVMVAFEVACRQRGDIRFLSKEEILAHAPPATRDERMPFDWRVSVPGWPRAVPCIPDGVFGLHLPDGRGVFFCLEADTGSMAVDLRDKYQSSILRHMTGYYQSHREGVCKARFGWENFRVLFATDMKEPRKRLESFYKVNCKVTPDGKGSGIFLFNDKKQIVPASFLDKGNNIVDVGGVLTAPWLNGRGKKALLLQ